MIENEELVSLFVRSISQVELFFRECGKCYTVETITKLYNLSERYVELAYWKSYKNKLINELKEKLKMLLEQAVEYNDVSQNKQIRQLHESAIVDRNIISVFESTLTRTLGMETDSLSEDIIIVKTFYYEVTKDLILNGFIHRGEKYKFFTASAGQIRTKKTVFIKEALWERYKKTLMCGLTINRINELGGINVNKFLAYMALSSSATDLWEDFDIDRCIVVPDFETAVHGIVDHVDDITYTVARKEMDISIEHTDGCGMMLPSVSDKNFMFRAPWIKGLLAVFDFRQFIEEYGCDPVIKDVYGKEWNIIEDDIQIIFTKSQFKMAEYYSSWAEYKEMFRQYNCQAGTCKREEDKIKSANINYQMLQTLTDITDDEIKKIAKPAIKRLNDITSNIGSMLEAIGASKNREYIGYFEQALLLYPPMIQDIYSKRKLSDKRKSMIDKYWHGKLPVRGKYTFVIPDLFAFCEHLFQGINVPDGLLDDGQVSCRLYPRSEKLDCLRPPHLYREHSVRDNVFDEKIKRWFITDAIYTSSKDLISRMLQFDNDGDTLLVVADKILIEVAERNMDGIVPLYYEMKKAQPVMLNSRIFYDGMHAAWESGTIGPTSNNITKIWNRNDVGHDELLAVKLLTAEGNLQIDSAKTNYTPTRPPEVNEFLKQYTNQKMPHFFKYTDKGYTNDQVIEWKPSFVNKLSKFIKKKRITFKHTEEFVYRKLLSNEKITEVDIDTDLISAYLRLSKEYRSELNNEDMGSTNYEHVNSAIRAELESFGYEIDDLTDMLVYYLYSNNSGAKSLLWYCYGDVLLKNLKTHIDPQLKYCMRCGKGFIPKYSNHRYCDVCAEERLVHAKTKTIICQDCGKEFEVSMSVRNKKRCDECQAERKRELSRISSQKNRDKSKT